VADLEKTVQIIFEAIDNMTDPIGEMGEALSSFGGKAGEAAQKADGLGDAIDTMPAEVELDISLEDNASDGINEIHLGVDGVPDEKEISFDCDSSAIGEVNDLIDSIPSEHEFDFYFSGDPSGEISDLGGAIGELPDSVELDIGVEAGNYVQIFDDFSTSVDTTRQEIEDLFADQPWELKEFEAEAWRAAIDEDMELKNTEFESQKKLIDQQLELLDMRKELFESGTALINIDTTGLEPILEDLLMSLCEKLQVRISESLPAFLVGIG
jgi:hypothetical protein